MSGQSTPVLDRIAGGGLLLFALGALFATGSELWFYPVELAAGFALTVLVYGLVGYLCWLYVLRYRVSTLGGLYLIAALFGFLIEGVPVSVLYAQLPFSLVWTSLAWHASLTIGVGFYLYRQEMTGDSVWRAGALNAAIGGGLGLWNGYTWTAVESTGGEVDFVFVGTGSFAAQFLLGWGLFVTGHVVFERVIRPGRDVSDVEFGSVAGIVAVAWLLGQFLLVFPLSLVLPVLVGLVTLLLGRTVGEGDGGRVHRELYGPIPPGRYVLSGLIPLVAIGVFQAINTYQVGVEANVWLILTAGPLSVYFLLRGAIQVVWNRR
jgi:hypothetical protein